MQTVAIVVSLAIAAVGIVLFVRAIRQIVATLRIGQPAARADEPAARTATMLKETLGHTRMLQWSWVGAGHWFVMVGFGLLFFTLVTAFGQLFDAGFHIPLLGHFFLYEWLTELVTWVMLVAITAFIVYRATRPEQRARGIKGRFFGSSMWQGYFVEFVILGVGICIVLLRGLEYALATYEDPGYASAFHFPLTAWLGELFAGMSESGIATTIYLVAMIKIVISFVWMITISLYITMGVAWHRFLAFFNIWFRRDPHGRTALGAVKPLTSGGERVSLEDVEELDEEATLGVGKVEDFSWKGILDFATCTECGRCQSQCPAWNTDKPLSPKLLITALRDHAAGKAPYLMAPEAEREKMLAGGDGVATEVERPLVGQTGDDDWFYMPDSGAAAIDPDVLWSCTSCGACVQQCPVDIEHVDHITDMRRYQVLVESNFPAELNGLFKGLENKGNPWNMSATARLDWAQGLDVDVKVVGEDVESLDEVEWLFWVGCAGAYEDRAKKTTRAVAELLDIAGVDFAVLGNGETCTGDPARRAGNEFIFQGLASQNAQTLTETKAKKVVATCAHCFNTLKNEYSEFGVELDVVHHTQLLNRLVREGKLTPVQDGAGAHKRSITYHDPCFIGRHNGVYSPPRELLQVLPGAEYAEMERNSERSFCCGAGGARMWMEENIGERINMNRTDEAVGTGADQIAVGCPFCRVMLSDGLTMKQGNNEAREEVEVLDVAQMLLASVKGKQATKLAPGEGQPAAPASGAAVPESPEVAEEAQARAGADEATQAEPRAGDTTQTEDTVTDTEDVGPAAKASGGSSLFDDPNGQATAETADEEKAPPDEAEAAKPTSSGGSLFDVGGEGSEASGGAAPVRDEQAGVEAPEKSGSDLGSSGGSLFDVGGEPEPATEPDATAAPFETARPSPPQEPPTSAPEAEPASETQPSADLGSGGSLFDIAGDEPAPAAEKQPEAEPSGSAATEEPATDTSSGATGSAAAEQSAAGTSESPAAPRPTADLGSGGSLFDIASPEPTSSTSKTEPTAPAEPEPEPETASSPADAPTGAEVSQAATRAASGTEESSTTIGSEEPSTTSETEEPSTDTPEPEDEHADRDEDGSRGGGAKHQPRTDTEIGDSGSLFDL